MDAELRLRAALGQQMEALEKALKRAGAGAWESAIITYHPEVEGAYVITLTDGASLSRIKKLCVELEGA